tara:strand:- start:3026 stop:3466 length:441 start_codon:yes stop_codon:yes gene_type:complete
MNLIILILFIIYSAFEGWREAIYWHVKGGSRYYDWFPKVEEHVIFTIQRAIVIIMGSILLFFTGMTWYWCVASIIGYALTFSFIHNGAMYLTRNNLDNTVYPKRWMAQSTSSVAKTTKFMTPTSRTIQFVFGILINIGVLLGYILL